MNKIKNISINDEKLNEQKNILDQNTNRFKISNSDISKPSD